MNYFKQILIAGIFLIGYSNYSYSQDNYSALNILVKFGSYSKYYVYDNDYNNSNNSSAGLNAFYEIPVAENLTVSPAVGLAFDFDWVLLGARVDYYFHTHIPNLPQELELRGGIDSGFVLGLDDFVENTFEVNFHAGGEWRFNEMWGALVEFGVGSASYGSIGVGIHL